MLQQLMYKICLNNTLRIFLASPRTHEYGASAARCGGPDRAAALKFWRALFLCCAREILFLLII